MAYTALVKRAVGYLVAAADWLLIKNNFAAGIPDIFTTKGDLAVGTGSMAITRLGAGSNTQALIVSGGTAAWAGGTVPVGIIVIWSGATGAIPTGWQLCNGTNGTIDLRDKFVVGAGSTYAVGATGGGAVNLAHTHTPTAGATANNNAGWTDHDHTIAATTDSGSHDHTLTATSGASNTSNNWDAAANATWSAIGTHTHDVASVGLSTHSHANPNTDVGGVSHSHSIAATASSLLTAYPPPYYALCYIQRLS
jgi:hypothetical protein